jgi:hypothetical protein
MKISPILNCANNILCISTHLLVTAKVADPDPYESVFLRVAGSGYVFRNTVRIRQDPGFKFSFEYLNLFLHEKDNKKDLNTSHVFCKCCIYPSFVGSAGSGSVYSEYGFATLFTAEQCFLNAFSINRQIQEFVLTS